MARAKRKTDKGVWSGVEGGITATRTSRNCMRIPFQAAGATRKADTFISMRQKLDGSSAADAEMQDPCATPKINFIPSEPKMVQKMKKMKFFEVITLPLGRV